MEKEKKFKFLITYVGTNYNGWQSQKNGNAVQDIIQKELFNILKKKIILRYPSRTDAGVHALEQVASFSIKTKYKPTEIQMMLNTKLPKDIVIKKVLEVSRKFDAQHAKKKKYYYLIYNSKIKDPFLINRVWWVKQNIDIEAMKNSLNFLIGRKDFKSFMGSGSSVKTTVRELLDIKLIKKGKIIKISFLGTGFLKHMVRNIVGTILDIGIGKIKPSDLKKILESKDRKKAGVTAPSYGLYLEKIYYD
jgi:tRNA pseudouridine38-40 synthase